MKKWTSIEQFRHVVAYVQFQCEQHGTPLPTLLFRGTVKLHGTNAGIRRFNGEYHAQGRNTVLEPGQDNYGFAAWLHQRMLDPTFKQELDDAFNSISTVDDDVTIYGEWIGKGIQSNVAVSQIQTRTFVIFGASVNDVYVPNNELLNMPSASDVDNVLSAGVFFISVDFTNPEIAVTQLEEMTLAVEQSCPYGKLYGHEGIGEGIVWVCMDNPTESRLFFKTKGEKHSGKGNTTKKVATVSPEKLEKISEVIDYILTAGRLQQGLEQVDSITMECLGQYLKWVGQDIQKEETDTLTRNGLEWKDVSKAINTKARKHYIECVDALVFNRVVNT